MQEIITFDNPKCFSASSSPYQTILVAGKVARLPWCLPAKGWSLHSKGYLIYTSRRKGGLKRGSRAHRVVMAKLLGRPLLEHEHVHHQDWDKLNCTPLNLVLMPCCFNTSHAYRDPYTGAFMSPQEWQRRYGLPPAIDCSTPDWVTSNQIASATAA